MKAFSYLSIALGATIIFASCSSVIEQSNNRTNNIAAKVAVHEPMDDMKGEWTKEDMEAMEMEDHGDAMDDMKGEWTKEEMEAMEMEGHEGAMDKIMDKDMAGSETSAMDKIMDKDMAGSETSAAGMYVAFSEEKFNEPKEKVLFFHASWCPACRGADAEITSRAAELPDGAVVLKTDYDSNKDLRVKYGVTGQHTFVFLDENNEAKKVKQGLDFDMLVAEL